MTADPARRLAEHPRWRWMPGMLAVYSDRVRDRVYDDRERNAVPDLTDPATAGCLLGMLLDECPIATIDHGEIDCGDWCDVSLDLGWRVPPIATGRCSLGEALAAALLELWGRER